MRITLKTMLIISSLIFLTTGCGENATGVSLNFISGSEGSKITLEYPDGTQQNIGSDRVFGWSGGQLLEGNYYRQLRIATDKGALDFRLSIPENMGPNEVSEGTHELRSTRLRLQNTGNLSEVSAELYFSFSEDGEFDVLQNANGEVMIQQSINHEDRTYDVVGEITASITNTSGQTVRITGNFWKQNAQIR